MKPNLIEIELNNAIKQLETLKATFPAIEDKEERLRISSLIGTLNAKVKTLKPQAEYIEARQRANGNENMLLRDYPVDIRSPRVKKKKQYFNHYLESHNK